MSKKPEVTLVNITPKPIETILWGWDVMHAKLKDFPNHIDEKILYADGYYKLTGTQMAESGHLDIGESNKLIKKFKEIKGEALATVLEYIITVWHFKASRAFQQQLTRSRIGFSYSIQSLREVEVGKFATDGEYYTPKRAVNDPLAKEMFDGAMKMIEGQLHYLDSARSMRTEDKRGIVPLNVYSNITMGCSLRALLGMLSQRTCWVVQDEFKLIVKGILEELATKVHKVFKTIAHPPCLNEKNTYCLVDYEMRRRYHFDRAHKIATFPVHDPNVPQAKPVCPYFEERIIGVDVEDAPKENEDGG